MYHLHTWLVPITDSALSPRQRANLVLGTDRQKKSVNRMAEFQEVVTNSKQRDPLVAEMNDYLTYFLVQKKEQHKIQTNVRASRTFLRPMAISLSSLCSVRGCDQAMRMVLLENVQRLRLLFPFTLAGSKP